MKVPFLFMLFFTTYALAESFNCSNEGLEVGCNKGKCKVDKGTPILISLDKGGSMEVCAYTGCWLGKGKVIGSSSDKQMLWVGSKLKWSHESALVPPERFVVLLDLVDNVALVKGAGYAMPAICRK